MRLQRATLISSSKPNNATPKVSACEMQHELKNIQSKNDLASRPQHEEIYNGGLDAYIQCLALKQDFTCTSRVVGFVKQSQNQVWLFKVVENATPNLEHRDMTHRSLHIYNISTI